MSMPVCYICGCEHLEPEDTHRDDWAYDDDLEVMVCGKPGCKVLAAELRKAAEEDTDDVG